jgi:hypothetical protein
MAKFIKGKSGNMSGRPRGYADFAKRCRDWADKHGFQFIADLASGDDSKIKLDATKFLVERGYGKSSEHLEVTGAGGLPLINIDWANTALNNPELAADISKLMGKIAKK